MVTENKLKILHVLSQKPDSTGSGIYVQAMIREAAASGYDNFLVAGLDSAVHSDNPYIEQEKSIFVNFNSADVCYQIPGMSDVMPYESTRFCDLSEKELREYETAFSTSLQTAVEQFQPDVIHSHHLWIISAVTRRLFPDIPMVTSCHGSDLRQFQNCPHLQGRVLNGCRKIDVVLALSKAQKDDISHLYSLAPEQITITGAGYDDNLFYPGSKPPPDPVQIVYAGKLSNAKGVPWLLRTLKSILSPFWQLHLLGSGSGDEKEYCLKLAGELGGKVKIHGALPQPSLARIMRKSHILVLPSFFEGLPLVLLEGLASGCRIVATDLPGANELLGSSDTKFISLVKTPRLKFIDQPFQEDESVFEQNLQNALEKQINASKQGEQIDMSSIQDTLNSYTWAGVFKKAEQAYLRCLS